MKYTDSQRLEKICDYCSKLLGYIENADITRQMLLDDYTVQWTVTTPLYNIGEHTYYISDDLKTAHPEIPWAKISGLRHRLVHSYDSTNWSIIVQVIFDELSDFYEDVRRIYVGSMDE